jgi:hypothetical protein
MYVVLSVNDHIRLKPLRHVKGNLSLYITELHANNYKMAEIIQCDKPKTTERLQKVTKSLKALG